VAAGDTIDAVETFSALSGANDRPNVALQAPPVQPRPYPTTTNSENVDYHVHMDLPASGNVVNTQGVWATEMDVIRDMRTLGYFATCTLSTAMTTGDIIYTGDLCPGAEQFTLPTGTAVALSPLSYDVVPFTHWSGSLMFKFVALGCAGIDARVGIYAHYGYEAVGLTVDEAMGQYSTIWEIKNGVSELTVLFPWKYPANKAKLPNGSYADASPFSMGQFSLRVYNAMQAPETTPQAIDILVYMCGGPDFMVDFVSTNNRDLIPLAIEEFLRRQGGKPVDDAKTLDGVVIVKPESSDGAARKGGKRGISGPSVFPPARYGASHTRGALLR